MASLSNLMNPNISSVNLPEIVDELEKRIEKLEKLILALYQGEEKSNEILEEIKPIINKYVESKSKEELLKIIK